MAGRERGPQNYNLFNNGIRDRVVGSKYLHSSIANFQNVFAGRNNYEVRKNYLSQQGIYKEIDILIQKARAMEDNFYADFNVTSAGDFSQQYLLLGVNSGNVVDKTLRQKILWIVNSINFTKTLQVALDAEETFKAINKLFGDKLSADVKGLNKTKLNIEVGRAVLDAIAKGAASQSGDVTKRALKKAQDAMLKPFFGDNLPGLLSSNKSLYIKQIVDTYLRYQSGGIHARIVDNCIPYFKTQCVILKISAEDTLFLSNKLEQILLAQLAASEGGLASQAFFTDSGQTGFVGEYGITLANNFSKVVGQKMVETVVYKLNKDSTASRTIKEGKKETRSEANPTDMEFIGLHSGRTYYIQAKNSFDDMFSDYNKSKERYSAKFNEEINIKSLMAQMVGNDIITPATANELMYALMNYEFLSQYNQNPNTVHTTTRKDGGMNKNDEQIMKKFISQLLANGILYYLGAESLRDIPKNFSGNLFVILANTFLVPISYFLEAIKWGLQGYQKEAMALVARPATIIKSNNYNKAFADTLYDDKLDVIADLNDSQYVYPTNLLKVGADAGEELLNHTKVSGIYINFNVPAMKQEFIRRAKMI